MMKRTKMISLLIALLLIAALAASAGCAKDKVLAAKAYDEEITVNTLTNMYLSNASYASYYGYDITTADGVEAFQDMLLDEMVVSAVKAYQAEQAGVTLTDEEEQTAREAAEKEYQSFYNELLTTAQNSGSTDVTAYANKLLTDTLLDNGMTLKQLKDSYLDSQRATLLVNKHREQLIQDVAPTEEEIQQTYNEELESQQTLFDTTPAMYFTYETYYSYNYTAMPLYVPAGLFYVRHILVDDLATAEEVMQKYQGGEAFETLLNQYNKDTAEPEEGYLVGAGASFEENFLAAALALPEEGSVSDIVKSTQDYGYHIIMRLGDAPAGVIPYEDIKDEFTSYVTNKYVTEYYNGLVEEWKAGEGVVYYPENYRSIGKENIVEAPAAQATAAPEENVPDPTEDAGEPAEDAQATSQPGDGE